jgi:hypothetical protein
MRVPSAQTLLTLWEEGEALAPFEQGLWLLAAACPEHTSDELALWNIGRRNARLLALHQALFGPQLACLAACPACAERLEVTFRTDDLRATPWPDDAQPGATFALQSGDYQVRFRLPTSADLAVLAQADAGQDGRSHLLQRCLLDVRRDGQDERPDELPAAVVEAVMAAMADADPQADVQLALTCPACGHAWQAPFEIVAYLWAALGAWAERTLREVHALASTYCWREADVLAMSARRRQRYLELAGR